MYVCVFTFGLLISRKIRHREREKLPVDEINIFVRVFAHNNVSEGRLPASKKSSEKLTLMSNHLHFWFLTKANKKF